MSEIRTCIVSRFPGGHIVECDFSQLEVVVQAMLTKCPNLITDLAAGIDMHRQRASSMFGVPLSEVTKEQRQLAKQCSFQLAYGAGYRSMAKKLKLPESVTKKFVTDFYARYPEIKAFNAEVLAKVERSSRPSAKMTSTGTQLRVGKWTSPTGRIYTFYQTEWNGEIGFSPTEIANYPTQGTAADIVALFRARCLRMLDTLEPHSIIPIGTVHDSLVFDVGLYKHVELLVEVLNKLLVNFNTLLGVYFPNLATPLQLKMDVKVGEDWSEGEVHAQLPLSATKAA